MSEGHWHLDKKLSVTHLITTVTVVVAVIAWTQKIEKRIAVTEVRIETNASAIESVRADQAVQYAEIIRRLERLDTKLDSRHASG